MGRRFACTGCGKCCHGWLPLTVEDALAHAGRFPLGMVWTMVRPGHKAFALTQALGVTVRLPNKRQVAVRITPTAYLPPDWACPALGGDNLCAIHDGKPLRCRTMPFFAAFEEADQASLLVPRAGWACDTSETAPAVYRDKRVLIRDHFDGERTALLRQAPVLRTYGEGLLSTLPPVLAAVIQAAAKPGEGRVILGLAALLPRLEGVDAAAVCRAQLPVLDDFAARTAGQPQYAEYHRNYRGWIAELQRVERRAARLG